MRCDECRFWVGRHDQGDGQWGECRRFPPNTHADPPDNYTETTSDLWCGEFQEKEHDQLAEEIVYDKTRIASLPEIEAMIRLDEREACAKIADYLADITGDTAVGIQIATSIRARSLGKSQCR